VYQSIKESYQNAIDFEMFISKNKSEGIKIENSY
jgi:hypothetical protein